MRRILFALLALFAFALLAIPAFAQSTGTQGDSLAWDQGAESLTQASGYNYHLTVDGAPAVAVPATCSGVASPFVCLTVPTLTNGSHTVTLAASVLLPDGRTLYSLPSESLTLSWVGPPTSPGGLRLVPAPQGLTVPPPGQ